MIETIIETELSTSVITDKGTIKEYYEVELFIIDGLIHKVYHLVGTGNEENNINRD